MGRREPETEESDGLASGRSLRAAMACFPTGVTIVASRGEAGAPLGLTVNSFTSVALEPPLVLVCVGRATASHDRILASGTFAVSVLSGTQGEIARRFASHPSENRFDEVPWSPTPSGNPVIEGCAAWLDCTIEETVEAGDHSVILARVISCESTQAPALLFHRGALTSVGS